MDDVKAGIQYAFQTKNELTLAVSGTGHAGMEAATMNIVERGDTILVAESGLWGQRLAGLADRLGKQETQFYHGIDCEFLLVESQ